MKVAPHELEIIALGYHDALAPAAKLAARAKYKSHTVRRTIQRFESAGMLSIKAFVDIYRLGLTQFELCYAIGSPSKAFDAFLRKLRKSPYVAWIGAYSGEYQYSFSVCCKSAHDLAQLLADISGESDVSVMKQQLAIRIKYIELPLICFSRLVQSDRPLVLGAIGNEELDDKDHLILSCLSEEASITTRELSRRVDLSINAAVHRVRSLEKQRIIAGYTYAINFARLGFQAFSLLMSVRRHTPDLKSRVIEFARRQGNFIYVAEYLGAYDFRLGVLLKNPSQIVQVVHEIAESFADEIAWLTTLTAFDYLKVSRYPFKNLPKTGL